LKQIENTELITIKNLSQDVAHNVMRKLSDELLENFKKGFHEAIVALMTTNRVKSLKEFGYGLKGNMS